MFGGIRSSNDVIRAFCDGWSAPPPRGLARFGSTGDGNEMQGVRLVTVVMPGCDGERQDVSGRDGEKSVVGRRSSAVG